MILIEEKRDLFTVDDKYYLAHCISDDFALGKGIAVEFRNRYNMQSKLKTLYPNGIGKCGCILIDNVFNLVTKKKYWHKPTYNFLKIALEDMKQIIIKNNIKYVAMPRIGCGLDRLQWENVKAILYDVFDDVDVNILVCVL